MRRIVALCAGGAALLAAALSAPVICVVTEAKAVENTARWDRDVDVAALYDAVVSAVERNFFDPGLLKTLDWRARAEALRPAVVSAATVQDSVRRINELLSELKTSHTGLFTPDDYEYYILQDIVGAGSAGGEGAPPSKRFWGIGPWFPSIGAFTRRVDGRHFVDGIMEGSPADRAGLKYGDEILSVDGEPYAPIAAFYNKVGGTTRLAIRRSADAAPESLEVEVVPIRPVKAFADATRTSARVIERNGARIGYVHVWGLAEANSFRSALAGFEPSRAITDRMAIQHARGVPTSRQSLLDAVGDIPKPLDSLIVDMRGRVGGNIAVADLMLKALERDNTYWGPERNVGRTSVGEAGALYGRNPSFRGRSALLVDHHTRSAGEIMAYGFKRSAFGPVIGTPSAGAVVSAMTLPMPGDLLLYVAANGLEFEGGHRLEGTGVIPDHRVERPLPYADGADPALETAIELLARRKSAAP